VLVALHGGGGMMNGAQFASGTGLAEAAVARGYVVLAPDALGDNWNDGRPELAAGIDDVGFIRAMIEEVRGRAGIDAARIFAVGASNGGLMSYRLACDGDGLFRAIAPVIAHLGTALIARCRPQGDVSIFMIPGSADRLMPYDGGGVAAMFGRRGTIVSSDTTLAFWQAAMGCRDPARRERLGTQVAITRYETCRGGAVVQRWTVEGGGHTWPGRAGRPLRARIAGATSSEFSATAAILDFFDRVGPAR
jgi:polyhydroxybutyrate depolymerase